MASTDMPMASGAADAAVDYQSSNDDLPISHKTACLQCRHQKIKCKPSPDGSIICSRCSKMRLPCIYQGRRERTSKIHKDKDALEPAPKRRLVAHEATTVSSPIATTSATSSSVMSFPHVHASPFSSSVSETSPESSAANLSPSAGYHDNGANWGPIRKGSTPSQTLPRRLEKVHVESHVIEDLFTNFFLNYSIDVPILDPLLSPNDYYTRSPLLFWSIMAVASRRYAADPTLLVPLSAATFKLAHSQSGGPGADIHTVEALVLLLSWHFPSSPIHEEAGFVLSGAMIHLAFKFGLHMAEASQDYVRVRLNLDENEIKRRRYLWATVVIVYQEVSSMLGYTCLQVPSSLVSKEIPRIRYSDPKLRLKLQSILTAANNAFAENGTDIATPSEERTLQLLIRTYEDEIKAAEVSTETLSAREKLYIVYASMQIQVMHFFRPAENIDSATIVKVYSSTVRVVEQMADMDREFQFAQYATSYNMRSMALAACVLLKIIKTPYGDAVNVEEAKSFFLTALQFVQKMTVAINDGPTRCVNALGRLWRSDRVFKNPDGSFNQRLRIRTRYAMSLLWDVMAWCREEFGTHFHAHGGKAQHPEHQATAAITPGLEQSLALQGGIMPPPGDPNAVPVGEQVPLSFDWSMEDWFFSPDMALAGEWGMPAAANNMMEGYSLGSLYGAIKDPELQNPFNPVAVQAAG